MPSNDTFVCFRCREVVRKLTWSEGDMHSCSHCHAEMMNIGQSRRVPKQENTKGWLHLEARVEQHMLLYGDSRL